MHEVSLGGTLCDYLTGEQRERTTYEDLRQALARYLVEERGYPQERLLARHAIQYTVADERLTREVDIAVVDPLGKPVLFLVFCPGQVHTFTREVTAMARLARPEPCPLAVVTDMRAAELFAVTDGTLLESGLDALPSYDHLMTLARGYPQPVLTEEQRLKEGRILHMYTGLLKTCCGEQCVL